LLNIYVMRRLVLALFISVMFTSCEKTLTDVPENEIPAWLKTRISQDEQIIKDSPQHKSSWGAWIRYKWQREYYFEYHNILNSLSVDPISENGDTLYNGGISMKYFYEKCCRQYVWKAPNYREY